LSRAAIQERTSTDPTAARSAPFCASSPEGGA
jgi:hypothetical protein